MVESEASSANSSSSLTLRMESWLPLGDLDGSACEVCGSIGNLSRCLQCKVTKYCSKSCQEADWDIHKAMCASFATVSKDALAHDFDYRMLVVVHHRECTFPPIYYEAEKVAVSMSNDHEESIMKGVQEGKLQKDDVRQCY